MQIRFAAPEEFEIIAGQDTWISGLVLKAKIENGEVLAAFDGNDFAGWLRYGLFWDSIPFVNMLRVAEPLRGRGIGKALILYFEEEMRRRGYKTVMTSSAQSEYAQHFYLKLGYKAVGGFTLENEPYELLFAKIL